MISVQNTECEICNSNTLLLAISRHIRDNELQSIAMNTTSDQTKAALLTKASEGSRTVLCTEIDSRDILPLIEGDKKLGGTLLDAIIVKYQAIAETSEILHWAALSSWFGPIVRKEVIEKVHVRTTKEYIWQ